MEKNKMANFAKRIERICLDNGWLKKAGKKKMKRRLYIEFYNKKGFVAAFPAAGGTRVNLSDTAQGIRYDAYGQGGKDIVDVRLAYRDVEEEENHWP